MNISLLSQDGCDDDCSAATDIEILDNVNQADRGTSQSDVIEQAIDDHVRLNKLAEIVSNSKQGVDENTAIVVELAVESIRIRCGFSKSFKVSTENFSNESSRIKASEELSSSIRDMQVKLGKSISVAQEGLIDDIKFRLSNMFTSTKGLKKRLVEAGTRYDNRGAQDTSKEIKCGGWGNRLNRDGKSVLDGSIAIKYMTAAEKIITNSKFVGYVGTATKWMGQVEDSVRDCWFFSKQSATDEILDVVDEADKYLEELKLETTSIHRFKNNEAYAKPLSQNEKDKLQKIAEECLTNNALERAVNRFCQASEITQIWILINSMFFRAGGLAVGLSGGLAATATNSVFISPGTMMLAGAAHSDMRAAYKALRRMYDLVNEIYSVLILRDHICLAAVKYIEESTKTGRS
jgi:hypothetical protein